MMGLQSFLLMAPPGGAITLEGHMAMVARPWTSLRLPPSPSSALSTTVGSSSSSEGAKWFLRLLEKRNLLISMVQQVLPGGN